MKNKPIILIILFLLMNRTAQAQDIHFSQFFEAPLVRNPSLAGIFKGDIRVQGIYRDQWNSVTQAFRTGSLNGEYKMPIGNANDFITAGLQVLYDRAGTIGWTSTHVMPALNYHKSLSSDRNRYLSVGFMGGLVQRRFDRSKMTTNSQYDGLGDGESFDKASFMYADGSAGISYNAELNGNPDDNFYLGVAYHHFNRPRTSFYQNANIQLNPKWVFSGGLRFGVTDYAYITVQADYSRQGTFTETVAGGMYGLKLGADPDNPAYTVHAGAFIRWNDALIPVLKFDYSPFSVAISYDVNISKLKPSSYGRGGIELSVSYTGFLSRLDKSSLNSILCPKF